jgi:hypothetical protein
LNMSSGPVEESTGMGVILRDFSPEGSCAHVTIVVSPYALRARSFASSG